MPSEDHPQVPFDEQAALEQLERLKHDVEESRQRRKDASAAFDTFVSSFRKDKDPADNVDPAPRHAEPRALSPRFDAHVAFPIQPRTRRQPLPMGVLVAGVIAIAAVVVLTRVWWGAPSEQPANPHASVQTAAGAPPALPAPSGQTAAGGLQAELVTIRSVWVRATADGVRLVERELRADERIPLRASQSIVIRAGDGGAVKLLIDGQDRGALGPDGIVVTRTFTASSATGR